MAEREPLLGPSQGEAPFHIIFGPLSVEFDMRLLLACDAGLSLVAVSAIGVSVGDALVLSLLRIAAFFGDDGGGLFLDAVSTTLLLALFRLALLAFSENVSPYNLATFVSASCVCALAEVLASSLATTPSPPQQLHGTSVHSSSPVRHSASDVQIVSIHVRDEAATPPLAHNDPANSFEFPDLLENALNAKELKYDDDGASDYGIDAATPTGRNHLTPLFAKAAAFSSSLPNTSHIRIADEDSEAESAERPNMSSSMFVTAENAANAIYRKYNQQSVKLDEKSQAAQETLDDAKGNSSSAQEHITSVSSITLTIHHPLIKEAVDHMWNGEYRQAETLLRDPILGGNVASSIRASVHLAELHTLIQFVSASDSDISKTMESLKNAENLIKRVLDSSNALMQSFASLQFGEGPLQEAFYALFKLDVECCYADILFFKGIHQVLMGREIKGTA
ncbi:hypothetical protein BC830DRAFT_544085 [Chytriomyces sp. MP71]|nr:hypothetical protein BC830DRAFT_544085 [Chytriomyces sp. MP71]